MLVVKMLARNWRGGELKLLGLSLVLAVAVLSGIAIFTDRLEATLTSQSNSLLGADYLVRGSQMQPLAWDTEARNAKLKTSRAAQFSSMVYAGDEMQLAAVKAVDSSYPLRGQFETSHIPFAVDPAEIQIAPSGPAPGEAWVDSRLLPLLNIHLGDEIAVGEKRLRVTRVLIREPDGASQISLFGARVLMSLADLPATQVIQPGSRIEYLWLLAADNQMQLKQFVDDLKPRLGPHQRLLDIQSAQERLGRTLDTGRKFLLLAAVIALLLAGVAIAICAGQFARRHTDQVALMKSLGLSKGRVRALYFGQLLLLGFIAAALGLILGELLQLAVAALVKYLYHFNLGATSWAPYVLSFSSGIICLLCFALPPLWFLPAVPPLKILRREITVKNTQLVAQGAVALVAIVLLVLLFSHDWQLAFSLSASLLVVIATASVLAWGLLAFARRGAANLGGFWRLAFASLARRRGQTLIQIMVFAVAVMMLLSITLVRASLINDWRAQVPENAPNHFLVNIPADELQAVQTILRTGGVTAQPVYPMVRGRLVAINGSEVDEAQAAKSNALQRELNLTWAAQMGADNKLVEGVWWDKWQGDDSSLPGISVEQKTANEIGLKLGDKLKFSIGGLDLEGQVASIRTLDWRSMNPNFFFIFQPGSLEQFSPTYITSVYLAPDQKQLLNQLLRAHPTIVVIELDRIIAQIQSIVAQVSDGVLLVLLLTLVAGVLVLWAAVLGSMEARKQEAGLLRALGSSRRLVQGSITAEFAILGTLAGAIAILGSEALLFSLQTYVLHTPIQPHYLYWLVAPVGAGLLVSSLGYLACRPVIQTPPAIVLRET